MKYQKSLNVFFVALLGALTFLGCVKTTFDEPSVDGVYVDIQPNKTINELKALHTTKGGFDLIKDDIIICGEVTMDDRSGNFYKTLVIEDASGGIEVKFNDGFLFNEYPIGRSICIRCKDLILTDYNGVTQITGSLVEQGGAFDAVGLVASQVRLNVVKGRFAERAKSPKIITLTDIASSRVSTLIRLDSVQFIAADTAKTYADSRLLATLNRTIEDCNGRKLIIRTSGYSNFANIKTPTGRCSVVGVLSVFGTTFQLYLRSIDDVTVGGARCGGGSTGGGNAVLTSVSNIRKLYAGAGTKTTLPDATKVKGIVISDRNGKNLNGQNVYIQDGAAGIVVRFTGTHSFNLNDEIEIVVSKAELSDFNKLVQINNVPLANAKLLRTGQSVTLKDITVADLNTNFDALESTLVRIKNATVTGGATLSGSRTVGDGTGTIVMFTQTAATFAGTATPSGSVTITAIVSDFNGKQIILRNATDIQQ